MKCSENIKKLRDNLGESQALFAKKLGVKQTTISQYEHGHKKPSVVTAYRMLKLARKQGIDLHLEDIFSE